MKKTLKKKLLVEIPTVHLEIARGGEESKVIVVSQVNIDTALQVGPR